MYLYVYVWECPYLRWLCEAFLSLVDHLCFGVSRQIPELLQIPMTESQSQSWLINHTIKIINIPLAFHKGYANKEAKPTLLESNLIAIKLTVWACWLAKFLGKRLKESKEERTNKHQNSWQSLSFFFVCRFNPAELTHFEEQLHAGISPLTTLFLTSWQNKTSLYLSPGPDPQPNCSARKPLLSIPEAR